MRSRIMTVILSLSVVTLFCSTAVARDWGACAADHKKFCKGVKPGAGRIAKCMWQHRAELSERCKAQVKKDWEKAMEVSADCADDAAKLCKGIIPGRGRIAACLLSHEDELSADCKKHADKYREGVKKVKEGLDKLILGACKADRDKFCKDVKAGQNRIINCLCDHKAELKPACRRKIRRIQRRQRRRGAR